MQPIWVMTAILNLLVEGLLLLGTNRLRGCPSDLFRVLAAAVVGGGHTWLCLLPGFRFLGSALWRLVFLALMAVIAFGMQSSALGRCGIFALLHLALDGLTGGVTASGAARLVVAAAGIGALCLLGEGSAFQPLIPVELNYRGKHLRLTALRDTGNTLRDPVTGRSVLVVGVDAAKELTGLTQDQLRHPVETMGVIPGLRLIPYHTVGQEGGLLLALPVKNARIGSWKGSALVALAPEGIGQGSDYQALTGGMA